MTLLFVVVLIVDSVGGVVLGMPSAAPPDGRRPTRTNETKRKQARNGRVQGKATKLPQVAQAPKTVKPAVGGGRSFGPAARAGKSQYEM